jgi:hypothetical protein
MMPFHRKGEIMPILIILTVAVQAFFIYHVLRSGRPTWWAYVILSFPIGGSLIYYFVEIFPNSREHRSARKTVREIVRTIKPDAELQRRAEELEICGSMDNKMALAEECEAVGMYDETANLYKSCLAGAYSNDPQIIFKLAHAQLMREELEEVERLVSQLETAHSAFKTQEVRLLRARLLEKTDTSAALALYEELTPVYTGLEAKCRYATLLQSLGHQSQAREMFEEAIRHAKRFNINHDLEREWVRYAKDSLKD